MPLIKALSATLQSMAVPGMTPKALRAAVREKHPEASKKDVVRAAFFALTEDRSRDVVGVSELHSFALVERVSEDELTIKIGGKHKKRHHRAKRIAVTTSESAEAVN